MVGVSPAHRSKGLGSLLIAKDLAEADRDQARTGTKALTASYELYLHHGWKWVDEINL